MKIPLHNQQGEEIGEIELPKEVFCVKMNKDLMHQAVVAQTSNKRIALAHTKKRGEVRGGGKKPWRQKGTGRSRHGSIRSPIWAGGGVVFGPVKERNFTKKINKKMKKQALLMSLSSKAEDKTVIALDAIELKEGKTKEMANILKTLTQKNKEAKKNAKALMVLPKKNDLARRASSNLKNVKIILADSLNVLDILSHKYLIITQEGIDIIKHKYVVR